MDGESSEAALRQEVGHDCHPVLIDEFEHWHGRRPLLRLLRAATRGGTVVKGTPGGKPLRFLLRIMVWVASIDVELPRDADRNRFVIVEMGKPKGRIIMPGREEAGQLGRELLAAAVFYADEITERWARLTESEAVRRFGRLAEVFALPAAVAGAFDGTAHDESLAGLVDLLEVRQAELADRFESDQESLVRDILSSRIRALVTTRKSVTDEGPHPVGDLIVNRQGREELASHGILILEGGEKVFLVPPVIQRTLLRDSKWRDGSIGDVLARMDGAKRSRHRLAGGNYRGIEIPIDSLQRERSQDEAGGGE
jgi:hypothetical protein